MRTIEALQLIEAIYFRQKTEKRITALTPDQYKEVDDGLILSDSEADIWIPKTSIVAITYAREKDLKAEIAKALPSVAEKTIARLKESEDAAKADVQARSKLQAAIDDEAKLQAMRIAPPPKKGSKRG